MARIRSEFFGAIKMKKVKQAFLLAVAAVGVMFGCDRAAPNGGAPNAGAPNAAKTTALTPITLQLNWVPEPEFGGLFAALQDGLYVAEGLAVDIRKGGAQGPCAQLVASGQVPFAIVSGEEVLTLRARGGEIVAVFATFQRNPTGFMLHKNNPIDSLESLWKSSSTIGIDPGMPFVAILNEKYGGQNLKMVPYSGALATFLVTPDSVQQCFITAEPVEAKLRGVEAKVLSLAEVFNPYSAVIATNETYLKENRATVEAFVRATTQGWIRYLANPEKYNPAIAALNPSMTLEAMNIAAELERSLITPASGAADIGQMTMDRWSSLGQQLVDTKVIPACAPVENAFLSGGKSAKQSP